MADTVALKSSNSAAMSRLAISMRCANDGMCFMTNAMRCGPVVLSLLCLIWLSPAVAQQTQSEQDDATKSREEEMFGTETPEKTEKTEAPSKKEDEDKAPAKEKKQPPSESKPTRDDAIFGQDTTSETQSSTQEKLSDLDEKMAREDDKLALGGFLFMQANYRINESDDFESYRLNAPQLFDLFLDARPNSRVRAYFRGRLNYDFTIQERNQNTLQQDGMNPDLQTLGQNPSKTRVFLDQLWVKFDVNRRVYVTVGRQRIRWGAGRFWNPTDFLNATQIDPLALFDVRLGVDLLKVHLPIESLNWNFYALGLLGDAQSLKDVGGALRGEFVFGTNEITVSFAARRQTFDGPTALPPIYEPTEQWPKTAVPLRFGADYSGAIGPLDLKLEGALTRGLAQPFYRGKLNLTDLSSLQLPEDFSREDEWIFQGVIGAEVAIKYNDEDSVFIGGEYFYNQAGYDSSALYLWTVLQGGFRPLYLGRHYAALGVILPSPGSWNDSTFSLSAIGNLSDRSFLTRLDYSTRILSGLSINAFAMKYFGQYGEFRFKVDVPSFGNTPAVSVPAPSWDLGAGLRLSF